MFTPGKIHIDIETYSSVDLKKSGAHKYAASPDFEIMLITIGYYNEQGKRIYEQYEPTNGKPLPRSRVEWILDGQVLKYAFNAMFERVCLGALLGQTLDPFGWRCVMVLCGSAGLPLSLAKVSKVLQPDNMKLVGANLINYFAKPCKPTKANGGRYRNLPKHNPEKWADYAEYNRVDVATEWDIEEFIIKNGAGLPEYEWDYYAMDQRINDRGVCVDTVMSRACTDMAADIKTELISGIEIITGIGNARSVTQLRAWINDRGCDIPDLSADTIRDAIPSATGDIKQVLTLRERASRTSTDKYAAAMACADDDNRARGLFSFYGAYRTGRYASRRVQLQNLSRIHFADGGNADTTLNTARTIARNGDTDLFGRMYDNPIDILSQLIRTVFVAPDGRVLVAADYSAIEARALAWLAGEEWKLDVFRTHGKIYEATAARMFGVPMESVGKGSDLRQKGKVAELAFGYGGAVGAVDKMGFLKDGTLTEPEVRRMVKRWRAENPMIVALWGGVERAAIRAVRSRGETFTAGRCNFFTNDKWLFIELPSGRELAYYKPVIRENKWGEPALFYEGEDDRSQWVLNPTYGGKLVENITQAVSRDILCDAQRRLTEAGYGIVLHVHDEIVVEVTGGVEAGERELDRMKTMMAVTPRWADGLPLRADGFVSPYYKK
jgi:DNA polymerase